METIRHELRYALRQLVKSPGFALISILTLALGIGANIAVFSVTNAVLLNPSGIPHAENLVALRARYKTLPDLQSISMSAPDFADAAEGKDIFAATAVMNQTNFNYSRDNANPELMVGAQVSAGYFDVFEVRPAIGRVFAAEEDQPGAGQVVVLSHAAWKKRFAGDPSIVGRTLMLNQQPYRVIGIMGPDFNWPNVAEFWTPIALPPARYHDKNYRYNENLFAVGRLRSGATIEQANSYLAMRAEQSIASEGNNSFGRSSGWGMFSVPLAEFIGGNLRKPLAMLLAAVAMVLLIACANIAGLQLARASARQRDIALQVALGASRTRLIRQALWESILLTIAGLTLGFVIAMMAAPLLLKGLPPALGSQLHLSFKGPVLWFVTIIAVLCSVLCGVVPAWNRTLPGWFNALHQSGRSGTASRSSQTARSSLVVVQIALSLVLLAGAGLLISSLQALERVETGFQPYGLFSARLTLPKTVYDKDEKQAAFLASLQDRLRSQPGITNAAIADSLPFDNQGGMASFEIKGQPTPVNQTPPHGSIRSISPQYFATLRIPVMRGREFNDGDRQNTQQVAIIDDVLARQYFADRDPIGQQIGFDAVKGPWFTIVGVVKHSRATSLEADTNEGFYFLPMSQSPSPTAAVVVRSSRPAESIESEVLSSARSIDSSIPLYDVHTIEERINSSLTGRKFVVMLLGTFAGLALLLAALGLYGVISYSVRLRTRELGVRMALGAQRSSVLKLVLSHGLKLAAFGVGLGLLAAIAFSRVFSSLLFAVSVLHVVPWLLAIGILVITVLVASFLPARRAASIEPMKALRIE